MSNFCRACENSLNFSLIRHKHAKDANWKSIQIKLPSIPHIYPSVYVKLENKSYDMKFSKLSVWGRICGGGEKYPTMFSSIFIAVMAMQ